MAVLTTVRKLLRYPDANDPVSSGQLRMQQLAEDVDAQLPARGTSVVPVVAGQFQGFLDILFPVGYFSTTPVVQVTSESVAYFGVVSNRTAAGCRLWVVHFQATAGAANITVNWLAMK